jgi:ribosomal protein S12 methylthiotransferase accessory factor
MKRSKESSDIHALVQPVGGLFSELINFRAAGDEPKFTTAVVRLQKLDEVCPNIPMKSSTYRSVSGAGVGLNEDDCQLPALVEALERYCTCIYTQPQLVWATADELGRDSLDLDTIPRCSTTELAHPACPLLAPDRKSRIRWVRGVSLHDGRLVYIPAVMVYLYVGYANPAERIWIQISTGCAGHISYERALLSAILEVIERDALTITWLQKLPIPRIEIDVLPLPLASHWERYQRSSRELEYVFFNATTDVGVPTVYGLQIARANSRVTTLVSCSTAMDPVHAVTKVMRDMASCRIAFCNPKPVPTNWDDYTDLLHGATYMARAERAQAFDFLLNSGNKGFLSNIQAVGSGDEKRDLCVVLELLRRKGLEAFAIDLSTDVAIRVGLRVVRVVIPGLQPFSFRYRAQYRGHPRLYNAPRQMGYHVHSEEQLNHWPQPFS